MKNSIFSFFGSGLALLAILTIALIAGQAQSRHDKPEAADEIVQLDAGSSIKVERERIEKLEALLLKIRFDVDQAARAHKVYRNSTPVQ